jgi:hypothetical protein
MNLDFWAQFEPFQLINIIVAISGFLGSVFALRNKIIKYLRRSLGIDELRCEVLQGRILQNIHLTPDRVSVIEEDFALYQKLGGNGYIEQVYREWKATFERSIVKSRLEKLGR